MITDRIMALNSLQQQDWAEAALLHRINPDKNERRFYFVSIGPALFDPYAVIRMWGRIGGYQRMLVTPCQTSLEARKLATKLVQRRLSRGYRLIQGAALTDDPP
ncbi:MAG: WGR domain-containing protein [Anaerolineae bacterium]|nr:WGR domain-containing protein [Anaerolineae bacterium]